MRKFFLVGLLAACGDDLPDGATVYASPAEGGNGNTCAYCHSTEEPDKESGMRLPGNPVGNAANRPSWKGGKVDDLFAAYNQCVSRWLGVEGGWKADQSEAEALTGYLDDLAADKPGAAIGVTLADPPDLDASPQWQNRNADTVATGRALFNNICAACHGADGKGSEIGPKFWPVLGVAYTPGYVAAKVRSSSGFRMPYFSVERLSDEELINIVAYVTDENR
jgi:mono/diheme cytochrome c family protein